MDVREVDATGVDAFVACYNASFGGGGDAAAVVLGRPDWRLYLAYVDERPAAMGMLHIADGVGSLAGGGTRPDLRNRGAQTALIHRRIADAAAAGCELVASQCSPGTTSQANLERAGMRVACTKVWWTERRGPK